ncbi:MAG: DUF1501 domain-containing protein [Pseudomonadota bacterium]
MSSIKKAPIILTSRTDVSNSVNKSRRQFIRQALSLSALGGVGAFPGISLAQGTGFAAVNKPILAHIMMDGGPDMRHLFPPAYNPNGGSYGNAYWEARARAHSIASNNTAYEARWNDDYFHLTYGGTPFGILNSCEWLHDMWIDGKVAIICNMLADDSRDHDKATRNMERGVRLGEKFQDGSGWGGRLAHAASGNSIALTNSPRLFSFGPDASDLSDLTLVDNTDMLPIADMRQVGLPDVNDNGYFDNRAYVTRAVKHYYAERRATISSDSVFHQFVEHDRKLREFAELIDARLVNVEVPAAINALWDETSPISGWQARQFRNLYDAIACNDILSMQVASLDYGGWDTHDNQRDEIEPRLNGLFANNGALKALYDSLPTDARANTVFCLSGEFGRQLRDNGGNGTDHGEGNIAILIGDAVDGGLYGEMFPNSEIPKMAQPNTDTDGLTGFEHIYAAICEWVSPGSANQVFPGYASAPIESGVNFSSLLS